MTLDETFPILTTIEQVPLAKCKAAYDRFAASSPADQLAPLKTAAASAKSTRHVLAVMWPGNFQTSDRQDCNDFALLVEYLRRTEPQPKIIHGHRN